MGLIAVLATVLAACCGAAVNGVGLGAWRLPVLAYGLCLAPGAFAAARWPMRRVPRPLRWAGIGLAGAAVLAVIAVIQISQTTRSLLAVLLLAVIAVSALWPLPAAVRVSVGLSGASLLSPSASLSDEPALVLGVLAGSAVALAASARLTHDELPRLGAPASRRHRQVLTGAALALAVALAVGLLASQLIPPSWSQAAADIPESGSSGSAAADLAPGDEPVAPGDGRTAPVDFAPDAQYDMTNPGSSGSQGQSRNRILLRVKADEPEVWRTHTFDEWTGLVWRQSADLAPPFPMASLGDRRWLTPPMFRPRLLGEERRKAQPPEVFFQRFTVEVPYMGVLAAAPTAVQLQSTSSSLSVNALETVSPTPPLGRGASYLVVSLRHHPSEEALRASDALGSPGYPNPPASDSYLRLPGPRDRVLALASEITAGAPTSYDRVRAVERWLAANVRLDTRAGAVPPGTDVVDRVLFGDRAGSPPHLATAMAVLLRSLGIPTRLGVGFLPGQRHRLDDEFVVRARDAHAWVEVSFGPAGWQRFDPSGRIAEAEKADADLARLLRLLRRLAPFLLVAAAAAAGLLLWRLVARRRHERSLPWATRFWARLVKAGTRSGLARRATDTPAEYTAALARSVLPDERLREVGAIVTAAAFSGREPAPETRTWAEDVLEQAVSARRAANRPRLLRRPRTPAPQDGRAGV